MDQGSSDLHGWMQPLQKKLNNPVPVYFHAFTGWKFLNGEFMFYFRIFFLLSGVVTQLSVVAPSVMAEQATRPTKPNVVILLTDDQGTLDAGCYGAKHLSTPNIDALAKKGVRFTQAYAHAVCCPARAMLLTGRYPQRSGVNSWTQNNIDSATGNNMALSEYTLAEAFKDAGYKTGLFGKWHLGAHRDFGPMKQGFDEFFGIRNGFIDNYNHHFLHQKGHHDLFEGTTRVQKNGDYFPELMTRRALEFIDANKHEPFFLYVPFNIPHYPEQSLERFEKQFAHISDSSLRSYCAIMSTTDYYVGLILNHLLQHGLCENTIVIFMSDNGHSEESNYRIKVDGHLSGLPKGHSYAASSAGYTGKWIGRKGTFLEGGIRVPAIISYPGKLPESVVRDQIVTAMDWYPTLLTLCGIQYPESAPALDGHDILPVISAPDAKSPYGGVLHYQWQKWWMVRSGEWKLINSPRTGGLTLRRLTDEKPEVTNHIKTHPEVARKLKRMHEKWSKDVMPAN